MTTKRDVPPNSGRPDELARRALASSDSEPARAVALLGAAARAAIQAGDLRRAALMLHRRAALRRRTGETPVPDLAMAARLLAAWKPEQALLLFDLGQALALQGDLYRARFVLHRSEALARESGEHELVTAARHALARLSEQRGDYESARNFLRATGEAMIHDVENDLLATLRDTGNLPPDPFAERERARRQEAVERELVELKRRMERDAC